MTTAAESTGAVGVSNQLASLVPSFDPSKDDMVQYQQRVELVTAAWPKTKITELVTRLILNCQGSAFAKLQLHQSELLTGEESSVKRLIEILGGQWGRIPLEKQYQEAEEAIFHTIQRADESNDSFLARSDVMWSKLLARKLTLESLQAYITLRGSCLSAEDKKRVVMESEAEGSLTMKRVSEAIRLLGAAFFHDVTGLKKGAKTKVYDQTVLVSETHDDSYEHEDPPHMHEEVLNDEHLEALAAEGDADAALILDFEQAAQDAVQEDQDLAVAMVSYQQARHRLQERFKNRGFFPARPFPSAGKGKGSFNKGFGKGRGSNSWDNRPKRSLQDRIMNSSCRLCGQRGHWKAECPMRGTSAGSAPSTSGGNTAPTTTVIADSEAMDSLPLEFVNLPDDLMPSLDIDHEPQVASAVSFVSFASMRYPRVSHQGCIPGEYVGQHPRVGASDHRMTAHERLHHRLRNSVRSSDAHTIPCTDHPVPEPHCKSHFAKGVKRTSPRSNTNPIMSASQDVQCALFATHGTHGVLDLGASKTVIGSNHVADLLNGLDPAIKEKVTKTSCEITFKFGNEGVLHSSYAIVLPIGRLKLKVAIVKGGTPFLLSNSLMRALRARIDCENHCLISPLLDCKVPLKLTSRGLFLIDVNSLAVAARPTLEQSVGEPSQVHQTFVTVRQKEKIAGPVPVQQDQYQPPSPLQVPLPFSESKGKPHDTLNVHATQPETMVAVLKSQSHPSLRVPTECPSLPAVDHVAEQEVEGTPGTRQWRVEGHFPPHPEGPPGPEGAVRAEASGTPLSSSLGGRSRVDLVHSQQVCRFHQDVSPADRSVHHASCGTTRTQSDTDSCCPPGRVPSCVQPAAHESPSRSQDQGQAKGGQPDPSLRDRAFARHGGRRGRVEFRDVPEWIYGTNSHECRHDGHADSHVASRECIDSSDPTHGTPSGHPSASARGPGRSVINEDQSGPSDSSVHPDVKRLQSLIRQCEKELDAAMSQHHPIGRPFVLGEVFCSQQSPVTNQVQQLGGSAFRFGLTQGDLSTPSGRHNLFKLLIVHQPRNIWYSPVCGPWSSWSQFNSARSVQSLEEHLQKREQLLYQIALGIVLYRHQIMQGRHFHWEQPSRSLMFSQPGISEIHQFSRMCEFDLCEVGGLKDPANGLAMRKRLVVVTTSPAMFQALHGRTCRKQHAHQVIEGQTHVDGQPVRRSVFSEVYPRKFARLIAHVMCKSPRQWPFQWSSGLIALSQCQVGEPTLVSNPAGRVINSQSRKANFALTEITHPIPKAEQLVKRRRLGHKQYVEPCLEDCQEIISRINKIVPRVGKFEITQSDILTPLQGMFNDMQLISVVACRGMDRTMAPLSHIHAAEAPFRKSLMILRPSSQVVFEKQWENLTNYPIVSWSGHLMHVD